MFLPIRQQHSPTRVETRHYSEKPGMKPTEVAHDRPDSPFLASRREHLRIRLPDERSVSAQQILNIDIMDKNMPPQPAPPGFMPPPPYEGQPQPQPQHVIILPTTFGTETQRLTCPHCQANISTRVESEANTKTHLFALLLCVLGLWCCVPCPYCMDSCLVKRHYCPACNAFLGSSEN